MYEYKVLALAVRECEDKFNHLGRDGWRLVRLLPDLAKGMGVIAALEREVKE